jgi:uncharacterized protein YutE (UPF0331/DUF86 family)
MVDQNIIQARIEKIRECLARLRRLASADEDAFCQDEDSLALAERHLQIAIQSVIDIGHHVIADMDLGLPSDYKDVFRIMSRQQVISRELGDKLESMTGMRNILVHDYLQVDSHQIYSALQHDLNDFDEFIGAILKLI